MSELLGLSAAPARLPYREPFFTLDHDIRVPMDAPFVKLLAIYKLAPEVAEIVGEEIGWSPRNDPVEREMGRKWLIGAESCVYRVSYPAPFIVRVTLVVGEGVSRFGDDRFYGYTGDSVVSLLDAAFDCSMSEWREFFDEDFEKIVEAEADRLWGDADASPILARVNDSTGFGLRYGDNVVYFQPDERQAWNLVALMAAGYPLQPQPARDLAHRLQSRTTNPARWAQNLASVANRRMIALGLTHDLSGSLITGQVSWVVRGG